MEEQAADVSTQIEDVAKGLCELSEYLDVKFESFKTLLEIWSEILGDDEFSHFADNHEMRLRIKKSADDELILSRTEYPKVHLRLEKAAEILYLLKRMIILANKEGVPIH